MRPSVGAPNEVSTEANSVIVMVSVIVCPGTTGPLTGEAATEDTFRGELTVRPLGKYWRFEKFAATAWPSRMVAPLRFSCCTFRSTAVWEPDATVWSKTSDPIYGFDAAES